MLFTKIKSFPFNCFIKSREVNLVALNQTKLATTQLSLVHHLYARYWVETCGLYRWRKPRQVSETWEKPHCPIWQPKPSHKPTPGTKPGIQQGTASTLPINWTAEFGMLQWKANLPDISKSKLLIPVVMGLSNNLRT